MSQARGKRHGNWLNKIVKIPNLRCNPDKIQQFYSLENNYRNMLRKYNGNFSNSIAVQPNNDSSEISKEVYMPFFHRNGHKFLVANIQYNQGIAKLGGTVIDNKNLKRMIESIAQNRSKKS